MFEAVHYQLPKSVSFHQATKGKPRQAEKAIRAMLAALADDVQLHPAMELRIDPPAEWTDAAVAHACLAEARAQFGADGDPHEAAGTWTLDPDQLDAAIEFALSDERWPKQALGPIALHFSWHFNWRDFPKTFPEPLASWQRGTCSLMLSFHGRGLRVAPSFVFPVAYEDPAFQQFVDRLGALAPFTINPRHFRRMLVNPKTGGIRYLKLT